MRSSDDPAPAPSPPVRLVDRAFATLMATVLLALVGFVLAYLAALVVVKIGLGGPRLFVGLPLVAVGWLAWTSSATRQPPPLTARLAELVVAGSIAAATILLVQPSHPSRLLEHESHVTDVDLHGKDVALTFERSIRLTTMPPVGQVLALTIILAGLAIAGSAVGRCFTDRKPELE